MIEDAFDLQDEEVVTADVCVVGSGAAGLTIALRLIGSGRSVLLLESGGFEEEEETQELYRGTMSGINTWALDNKRWRRFGGSTARWAGWCMPLDRSDFEEQPHVPRSGWPIGFDDLAPYYALAAERVEIGRDEWDAVALAAEEGVPLLPAPAGMLSTRFFRFSPPTRFGTKYRPTVEAATDVRVLLHANVVEIVLNAEGDAVDRLECATLSGPRFRVNADTFVLAAGGIENARLLMASRGSDPAGVANSSGLLGRCFMEHPHLVDSVVWLAPGDPVLDFYRTRTSDEAGGRVLGAMGLSPDARASEGVLDLTLTLREVALETSTGELGPRDVLSLVAPDARALRLTVRAEQSPREDSRVTLLAETDALGVPRVDLRWAIHDDDWRSYRRSAELLGREIAAAGLGRLWTRVDPTGRFDWTAQPGGHHMGTTRMSESAADGVVDADCRCHDVENLYVAGSSVFSTGGSANPTLTIVALAERLAAHLVGES